MTKAKSKPKAKPEELAEERTVYILISGKHSRSLPDGTRELFRPGDVIPDPTPEELFSFGDKIVSAEAFAAMASAHQQAKKNKAERRATLRAAKAKAQAGTVVEAERDAEAIERAEVLKDIRAEQAKQSHIQM